MKYKKYISTVFIAILLLPLLSAKSTKPSMEELDLNNVVFAQEEQQVDLGFDTGAYLPEGFNPYNVNIPLDNINFMEDEPIELGFDTAAYLPEGFDPYKK